MVRKCLRVFFCRMPESPVMTRTEWEMLFHRLNVMFFFGKGPPPSSKGKKFSLYIYIVFSYVIFIHIHLNIVWCIYHTSIFCQCKYFIYGWYTEHDFILDQWVKYYDDQRLQYCLWNLCKCVYEWDFSELYFQPCITAWLSIYLGVPNRWHIKNVSVFLYLRKTSPNLCSTIFWYVSRFIYIEIHRIT